MNPTKVATHAPRLLVDEFEFRKARPRHICEQLFHLDWERFFADHKRCLVASSEEICRTSLSRTSQVSHLFKLEGEVDCLVASSYELHRVKLSGDDREEVAGRLEALWDKYRKPPQKRRRSTWFNVVKIEGPEIQPQRVEVTRPFPRSGKALSLNYGGEFAHWAAQYAADLRRRPCGLSIFQGGPGTGKTTFIRHLIHRLRNTHSFYYFPPDQLPILSSPASVSFWANIANRKRHGAPVVVIEDAESLLQRRGMGRESSVSTLLNATDGLGADFLNPQIICTINCDIGDLDPALLRPGRLVALRAFHPLAPECAARLVHRLGRPMPAKPNPTLAEIYGDAVDLIEVPDRTIGFAA